MTRIAALGLLALAACNTPDHIEIDPKQPVLKRRGETVQLHGKVMNRRGQQLAGEWPKWKSSVPFTATVDEHGLVTAVASGHALLTATYGDLTADVPVDVSLVEFVRAEPASYTLKADGDPVKPAVAALGANGRVLPDRQVAMTAEDSKIVHVDSEGKLWPSVKGTTKVHAVCDDHEAVVTVSVE